MATIPTVRLVVVNFNGGDDVVRCVDRLLAVDWPADHLEVVVVDNASTDGSAEAIAAAFPTVRLLRLPTNQGFPANNIAFADLGGRDVPDFVGLVNNDAFVEPGFLRPLVDALLADRGLGAACPKVIFADRYVPVAVDIAVGARLSSVVVAGVELAARVILGDGWEQPDDLVDGRPIATAAQAELFVPVVEGAAAEEVVVTADDRPVSARVLGAPVDVINNVGNELTGTWFGIDRGFGAVDDGRFDEPVEVFGWCGAAVLFPSAYLRDVGGFDERLFLYYEDLDLAWRGRARGWRYRTVPTSVVRHRLGATSRVGSRSVPLPRRAEPPRRTGEERTGPGGLGRGLFATSWRPLRTRAATCSDGWSRAGARRPHSCGCGFARSAASCDSCPTPCVSDAASAARAWPSRESSG